MPKISPQSGLKSRARTSDRVPRQLVRSIRENQILDAAFTVFAARGYAETRLEDVARYAGVSKGLPHFYFTSKQDLFRAVLSRVIVPTWTHATEMTVPEDMPTRDLLRRTLKTIYAQLAGNEKAREMIRLLIAEGPRFPELTELYHAEVGVRAVATWEQLLARGIARGEFRSGPVLRVPQVIYGPALMALIWQLLFDKHAPIDLDSWFEAHVDLVLNGLAKRPAKRR